MPTEPTRRVRLWRFWSIPLGQYGEPFGMCDRHRAMYRVPPTCVMTKLADTSEIPCNFCEQEAEGDAP